jgi:hypothetical protein
MLSGCSFFEGGETVLNDALILGPLAKMKRN